MTGEPATDTRETDADVGQAREAVSTVFDRVDATTTVLGASALAFVAAGVDTGISILANVPFDPAVTSPTIRTATGVFALVAVVVALVTVAVFDERATVRVGLLFAAVFGGLSLVAPAVTFPAVVAVVGGGALALAGPLGMPEVWTYHDVRQRLLVAGFVAALALTLTGVTGLVEGFRNGGAAVTLAAVAAVGTRAEGSPLASGAGLLAVATVIALSAVNPFVVGSTLLVAFAVTGVPNLLVALAVAGAIAATVAGFRRGEYPLAVGAALLLLAGVPATFPRALTLLLGAVLVLVDVPGPSREVAA